MKRISYFLMIIGMLGGASACSEILDTAPSNQISSGTMWTTEELVDQGVIGVYYSLQLPMPSSGITGESNRMGYYAYDVYGMAGQGEYNNSLFTSTVTPGNGIFLDQWQRFYNGVHRANDAIAHIPDAPMAEAKKARLVAECKTLRAFFYMRLNELFGRGGLGVPIYEKPVNPAECDKGQSPESEVWALIIRDLTDAVNEPNLPKNQIQGEGRISRGAAHALRGRAYLMTNQYDAAIADFAEVGKCGYSLYPNYKSLFKVANERCEEMIFSVQYIENPAGYGSRLQKYCAAYQQGSKDSKGCWTDITVAPAAVNLYEVIETPSTVKPFNWTDFIPEWDAISSLNPKYCKVFFFRDSTVGGQKIHATISKAIQTQLKNLSSGTDANPARALYIPQGNEARLKAAYANRDPRLAYNVVTPYANFTGVNSSSTAAGTYTYRFPNTGKQYFDQKSAEPELNKTLPASYYTTGVCNANGKFKYIHRKFVGEGLEYERRQDNPVDEPIIRYADVLLMWAEALVEKNNLAGENGAMSKVKLVRDRAGVPTMVSSFADQATARKYVRDERRRELLGEGVNFFDEMRWKTLKETKFDQKYAQHAWGGTESAGGTNYQWVGDFWYNWPVPKSEIELNPNLQRTPGWTY